MQNDLLNLKLPGFTIEQVVFQETRADVNALSLANAGCCPVCHQKSSRIHGHYTRHPADLPWCGLQVQFHLTVPRFFCDNHACPRRTFGERLPDLILPHAQKTSRLSEALTLLAFGLGGELGARLLERIGIQTSPDTLLRLIRRHTFPSCQTPRIMGVDDWASRKGRTYGTILCDLEKGGVIDLLPDRSAETLTEWLQKHPDIEIITRDRSAIYAEGITAGAPEALQVADRWHLLKNLRETIQKQLERNHRIFEWDVSVEQAASPIASDILETASKKRSRLQNETKRRQRYQSVLEMRKQGFKRSQIAQALGISIRTVSYYLAADGFPERKRRVPRQNMLEPYADYLTERWQAGCENVMQLWREVCQLGFTGSYTAVASHIQRLSAGFSFLREDASKGKLPSKQQHSPAEVAWLFILPTNQLKPEQHAELKQVWQHYPDLKELYQLTIEFCGMLRHELPNELTAWLQKAESKPLPDLHSFVKGIQKDFQAVSAALDLQWSNGPTEGQVNRLKLLKRQMYGRANFDLLKQKALMRI